MARLSYTRKKLRATGTQHKTADGKMKHSVEVIHGALRGVKVNGEPHQSS